MHGVDTRQGGRVEHADDVVPSGVYCSPHWNVVLAAAFTGAAAFAWLDFVGGSGGGLVWSRRVPIALIVAAVLVVRALRRAVIVSPYGVEARRMFMTWRVPWSAVESFTIGGSAAATSRERSLTVALIDGSTRSAHLGPARRGQQPFSEVAAAAGRHPQVRPRGYLDPNWPLLAFVVVGVALIVACAATDTGRANRRLLEAGEVSYTAEELHDLELEILVGGWIAVLLYVAFVATAIAAAVWSRRSRGIAPIGPWPARMRFPDDDDRRSSRPSPPAGGEPDGSLPPPGAPASRPSAFDVPDRVICREDGVFDSGGKLLAAISRRTVTWTSIDTCTYWRARGVASFSVQLPPAAEGPLAGGDGRRTRTKPGHVGANLVRVDVRDVVRPPADHSTSRLRRRPLGRAALRRRRVERLTTSLENVRTRSRVGPPGSTRCGPSVPPTPPGVPRR
jgi:hypothetical protein